MSDRLSKLERLKALSQKRNGNKKVSKELKKKKKTSRYDIKALCFEYSRPTTRIFMKK
jgi:hypothetical protein